MMISLATIERRTATNRTKTANDELIAELGTALQRRIEGEVRFDRGSRALYATDASNYRQVPIGVVIPRSYGDVEQTFAVARQFQTPVLSRGGGTSLAGQCCNVAVVIDFTKYLNRVLRIDPERRLATVQAGCVLDDLREAAKRDGLTFGPDPATHSHCALGGMLGNNSCGIHSLLAAKYGRGLRTSDNTENIEILTYRGLRLRMGETPPAELERIIRRGGPEGRLYAQLKEFVDRYGDAIRRGFPNLPRRVSGYNLPDLLPENGFNIARALVGSESTLVAILEATLHLVPEPGARSLLVLGYPDVFAAGDHVTEILPFQPTGLEGLDHLLIQYNEKKGSRIADLKYLPDGRAFLLVEFGGNDRADADAQARRCMAKLKAGPNPPSMKLYDNKEEEEKLWKVRESGLGATAFVPGLPDMWPGWEDSAVPPENVGPYLRDLRKLFSSYGYNPSLYGHFGQGCVHCRVDFDLYTAEGIQNWRSFLDDAADLVVRHGGSLSGEHGDGQARGELLSKMFDQEIIQAFHEFKSIWDPDWKMNPGKIIDANPIDADLRLGPDYSPPPVHTHFQYPNDQYTFDRAALRCVGVGECRKHGGQVMCPSYMVTREEMHSTRGRARLLWEMLNGELRDEGWRSESVKEALDLCLACKGCKNDCPVNVDMATYKAEFLSHYYEGRMMPRSAYAMGLVNTWARFASLVPSVANFFSQTPGLSAIAKWIGGIAQQRKLPPFAPQTFKDWFRQREPRNQGRPRVILWPDTFNNYFHPEVAKAAVEVIEAAGFQVVVPVQHLCCGRPLYDYGMLDRAEALLRETLDALAPDIRAGVPVVGLEPSCIAVFRDELANLFPHDQDAQKLNKQSLLLSEFLEEYAGDFELPKLGRRALVHGHCHHKSVMGMDAEKKVLERLGLSVEMPEDGCCGMAGSFGYEADKYDVSIACGERVLLPAVRQAARDTIIVADGFSCQEQISDTTDRRAMHLAQVIQMAMHDGPNGPARGKPERHYPAVHRGSPMRRLAGAALVGGGIALAGFLALHYLQRDRRS